MTEYDASFGLPVAFQSGAESNTFADTLSNAGMHMYRIGESERFAHITNFFDGGVSHSRPNEKHLLIQSAKEADREYAPEMRSFKITDALLHHLETDRSGVFVANLASPGLIAETGNYQKTVEAVQYVDTCLGGIMKRVKEMNGLAIVTGSHGNCEDMSMIDNAPNRHSTGNRVPFHLIGNRCVKFSPFRGRFARDIAPTDP
jgi:2,3-bisphosphoglycerate-independent phosphoglycerate mutase